MLSAIRESLNGVVRSVIAGPQRILGALFDAIYVNGSRYACYNQQPYLDQHSDSLARSTGFDWTLYQVMLSDEARLAPYRADIDATVADQSVLEIGPGPTAVLTRMAIDAGARSVLSVEGSPWVARSAERMLRRANVPESRARVVSKFSDDLTTEDTGGQLHFDVLLLESYHAIASQERVVETIATLREHGFSFDKVISRGFATYVAPAAAPSQPMLGLERVVMGWPAKISEAREAMAKACSSLHGNVDMINSLTLADHREWQRCDFEAGEQASTAAELSFKISELGEFAGFLFWNDFYFHNGVLNTGTTSTDWGAYFVPFPAAADQTGEGTVVLRTDVADPATPSLVTLTVEVNGVASEPTRL